MGFIRFILWTACAVGLGVFISTYRVEGKTPLDLMTHAWHQQVTPARVAKGESQIDALYRHAKAKLNAPDRPSEHHSRADRARLEAVIAARAEKK